MVAYRISDWDGAYANRANIAGGERWPDAWAEPAKGFREAMAAQGRARLDLPYGDGPRSRYDLFLPAEEKPRGLLVFVHGGYWMAFDKSSWSHLAGGAVAHGFAVAMPSYPLCPDVRIADITRHVGAAVAAAAKEAEGPLFLAGHSAGGHLAARMACAGSPLPDALRSRLAHTVSIAGLHDLRPLMRTAMQATLRLDAEEARAESPALLEPIDGARVTCWVGAGERAEFLRQNALLANVWRGLGAETAAVEEPDRHHFSVIDGLANPDHALTRTLLLLPPHGTPA